MFYKSRTGFFMNSSSFKKNWDKMIMSIWIMNSLQIIIIKLIVFNFKWSIPVVIKL